jgi:hypothetical protein
MRVDPAACGGCFAPLRNLADSWLAQQISICLVESLMNNNIFTADTLPIHREQKEGGAVVRLA